jgi:hypothetical protein
VKRTYLGTLLLAGVISGSVLCGLRGAGASESYERVTNMKCKECHKIEKEEFKEKNIQGWDAVKGMDKCGVECQDFLKKQPGFKALTPADKKTRDVAETTKWALVLLRAKWKCSEKK